MWKISRMSRLAPNNTHALTGTTKNESCQPVVTSREDFVIAYWKLITEY